MQPKISPTELNSEELLKLLDDIPVLEIPETCSSEIINFISYYNIKSGSEEVNRSVLYNLYKLWSKNPVTTGVFFNEFNRYFIPRRTSTYRYYCFDVSAIDMNKTLLSAISKQSRTLTTSVKSQNHFNAFLNHFTIETGKNFIDIDTLYRYYNDWVIEIGKTRGVINKNNFKKFCKVHFTLKSNEKKIWVGINMKKLRKIYGNETQSEEIPST